MKKRIVSALLSVVLSLSLTVTTFAADLPQTLPETVVEAVVDEEATVEEAVEEETSEIEVVEETVEEEGVWVAEDFTYENMSHKLYGCDYSREFTVSGLAVSGFSESGLEKVKTNKNLVIPEKAPDGTKIMGVADDAFKNQGLTGLTLPKGAIVPYDDTVTHVVTQRGNFLIGVGAFSGNNLTKLVLPEGIIAVLSSAFKGNQLESVTIPQTVWWLENSCFANNNLSTVNLPKTCDFQLEIHAFAFASNKIKSVRLPDFTMVVEKKAFYWNPGVESVPSNAPSGEEEFGGVVYMYTDNPNLANMERIHHIDRKSETQLSWHQKLIIGGKPEVENTWTVDDFTFNGTTVTGLSASGLKKSQNDKELTLPEKTKSGKAVTAVKGTFKANGKPFEVVLIPDSIVEIGDNAFVGCPLRKLELPTNLQKIGVGAFSGNELEALFVPGTVEVISKSAFAQEKQMLQVLTLGEGIKEIQTEAFAGCDLTKVNLPDSLEKLDVNAFKRTAEEKIILYTNIEKEYGKSDYHIVKINLGDWNIEDFTYEGNVVTGFSEKGLLKSEDNENLVIPDKTPEGEWITAIADTTSATGLFATEEIKFESVKLPSHIERIGNSAFRDSGLKKVTFPVTLTAIGNLAFQTNKLAEVILPDSVETIGSAAFATNPMLGKIVLSKELTVIPASAFMNNDSAPYTEVVIPEKVTDIGSRAFAGNSIKKLEIPVSVLSVGSYAFSNGEGKESLQELILHEGLQKINSQSFAGAALKTVDLPSTVTTLNKAAFKGNINEKVVVYVPTMEQYTKFLAGGDGHIVRIMPTPWDTEDFTYEGTVVTGFSEKGLLKREDMKNLVIPDKTLEGEWVTAIGDTTMQDTDGIFGGEGIAFESLTLPAQVEKIGIGAFRGIDLKKVTFPETLKEIGAMAFHTNSLEEIVLPDSVVTLGNAAFMTNPTIEKLVLSKSLKEIPTSAFGNAGTESAPYTELIIPEGITSIKGTAFAGNSLEKLEIPGSVKDIGSNAFANGEGNETLQELILHEGLTKINSNSFKGSALTTVDLPSSVTTLNKAAFAGNFGGNVIVWANAQAQADKFNAQTKNTFVVRLKDEFTFEGTKITGFSDSGAEAHSEGGTLILPRTDPNGEVITEIADAAANQGGLFKRAEENAFTEVILPSGLKRIGKFAFQNSGIEKVTFQEGMEEIGQSAFQYDHLAEIIIPDSVTTLGAAAFMGNEEITNVVLSKALIVIPASAFAVNTLTGAENFTNIEIPEGVEKIDTSAFGGHHFKKLVLPDSVKAIGSRAFMQSSEGITLESVVFSKNLETIAASAFANSKLTFATIPNTLKELNKSAFANGISGTVRLYTGNEEHLNETSKFKPTGTGHQVVYEDMLNHGWTFEDFTYDGTTVTGWSEQGNITRKGNLNLVLPSVNPMTGEEITAIGDSAFRIPEEEWDQGHTGVESVNGMETVVIPETVTVISAKAFQYNNLVTVDFPEGLLSIGENAFNSNKMTSVNLPDSIIEMSGGAFSANNLTEIKISRGLTKLEDGVFSDNIRLSYVEIPDTIVEIGNFAFSGDRLETLTIPKSVTTIGRAAFKLHHLTELTIPGNVKTIGESAFEGTYKAITLKKLILEEGIESIGSLAFRMGYLETVDLPESIKELAPDAFKNNTGVDAAHVVLLYTTNEEHLKLEMDETCQKIVLKEEGGQTPEPEKPENPEKPGTDHNGAAKTGDTAPMAPFTVVAVLSLAVVAVLLKKKKSVNK